jgi:hypothetical protein
LRSARVPTVKYLRDQRHAGTVDAIAKARFPFPNEAHPDLETIVNIPVAQMAVGQKNGKDLFPDLVVVGRPGTWLREMACIEMADTLNDTTALERWAPLSECGALYVYVPAGMAGDAKKLLKRHKIKAAGIRTWRFRPVWGVEVAEV